MTPTWPWHLTCDLRWGVNILTKFHLSSPYGLDVKTFWRFGGKGSETECMSDKGVRRTAPATPGLLIIHDTRKKVGLKSLLGETWRPALCTPQLLLVTHQQSLGSGCYWHLPNEKVSPGCIQLHSAIHGWETWPWIKLQMLVTNRPSGGKWVLVPAIKNGWHWDALSCDLLNCVPSCTCSKLAISRTVGVIGT